MDIISKLKLDQKSTWTGGGSVMLLGAMFGLPDVQLQAACGIAIAVINLFDVFRNEKK